MSTETITITIPASGALSYRVALSCAAADITLSGERGPARDAARDALRDLWQQIHDAEHPERTAEPFAQSAQLLDGADLSDL